jgi:hypothetical protein
MAVFFEIKVGVFVKNSPKELQPQCIFLPGQKECMEKIKGKALLGCLAILQTLTGGLHGQKGFQMTRESYIRTYSELAMKEMARVGIPASITLAQGCLESDNGNSRLAVEGNNHFGIKCHDWTGRKIYQDDDSHRDCFRSYDSPYASYMDHSNFLTTRPRYAPLFELKPHDYRGWAKGLKEYGYATAPNYAALLIKIIEENELYRYDLQVLEGGLGAGTDSSSLTAVDVPVTTRKVMMNNRIEYILAEPGDTPESIREEMDLYRYEVYRYNSLYKGEKLEPGQVIYLQPKRNKAARGNEIHVVEPGQTMYDISQKYGVKIESLYRMNLMTMGSQPVEGTEIRLRNKLHGNAPKTGRSIAPEAGEENGEQPVMQFRFEE